MNQDTAHMKRALRLGLKGRGKASPNPLSGALIARGDQVVGEGAYLGSDRPHAALSALDQAGRKARNATLYITFEPCPHPCAQALRQAGIARVVCAQAAPGGKGLEALREAGLQVEVGLLEAEAARQNASFLKHRRSGRPLVILKLAQSLDGRIATRSGASKWITGAKARTQAHRLRAWVDGIAVGAGTVRADDPQLDVRHVKGQNPRPLVIDGRLRTSPTARVFSRPGAILVTGKNTPARRRDTFARRGVEVWTFAAPKGRIHLDEPLARAGGAGITSLLIEGGGQLAAAALRDRIVDQLAVFVAPRLFGEGIAAVGDLGILEVEDAIRLEEVNLRRLGPDLLYTATVRYPCSPDLSKKSAE